MRTDKRFSTKIAYLIESLSALSGEDLEEAKTILREAGKDPEKIVAEGIKRLQKIQSNARKNKTGQITEQVKGEETDHTGYLLTLHETNRTISLEAPGYPTGRLLMVDDIFTIFVKNNGLYGVPYGELSVAAEVTKLVFNRILRNISFEITMEADDAGIATFLQRRNDKTPIEITAIDLIAQTGYYIVQGNWYPVENDSISFAIQLKAFMRDGRMPLKNALDYFGNRYSLPWISFQPDEMDLSILFRSKRMDTLREQLFIRSLYDYQQDGLKWLQYCVANRIGGILGDDMGLGKTAQTIALIAWIIERDLFQHILIVVPGTLLENWKREFAFFTPSLVPYIHHGPVRTGSINFLKQHQIVVTSYSMIISDVYLFDKINWGVVFLDEASLIKNPESERRVALKKIPAEVRIAMSGTPVENSLQDLWSLADYVYPGYLGTKAEFAARYINKNIQSSFAGASLKALKNSLSWIMLRRKKEDVLTSLPEKVDVHQALVMNYEEATLYEQQRNNILNHKDQFSTPALQMIQELRQFTTHPLLVNGNILDASLRQLKETSVKFCRTVELLDEVAANGEKILIFTEYLRMIDVLQKVLSEHYQCPVYTIDGRVEYKDRQVHIDLFAQQSGFAVMVLNPRTAGMGLNITAANHVIHYTRQWNPALEDQATARAFRNGQQKGVNVYYLYYADTIEESIDERLRAKQELSDEVVDITDTEFGMEEYLLALQKSPVKK